MLLLRLIMFLVMAASFVFTVTQVLVPLFMRTALFPMFRKERTTVLSQIQETKAQIDDAQLKAELADLRKQLAEATEQQMLEQSSAVAVSALTEPTATTEGSTTTTNTGV